MVESKPRVVEVKKLPSKPRIVSTVEPPASGMKVTTEEDYSRILQPQSTNDVSQKLRQQQLRDILPVQPQPGEPLQALDAEVRKKIEDDRKKRRGLGGEVKDLLGLK